MNRVIFTNGCFDILHRMHIELLKFCKSRGDYVIVGLNSDASVKALKGDKRPINKEDDRKYVLESLKFVDEVIIFEEETPFNLVKELRPDEIVKGGDYNVEDIAGHEFTPVVLFNYNNSYSTTKSLEKLNS